MYIYVLLSLLILLSYVFYRYYYKPKSEISRYKAIFKRLGYTFYEIPFAFMGLSFMGDMEKGRTLHKDALYF
jgi:hypothetical protein